MTSSCIICEAPALAYHGIYAYCNRCIDKARRDEPDLHRCARCGKQQPGNVSWHRVKPCKDCQHAS